MENNWLLILEFEVETAYAHDSFQRLGRVVYESGRVEWI